MRENQVIEQDDVERRRNIPHPICGKKVIAARSATTGGMIVREQQAVGSECQGPAKQHPRPGGYSAGRARDQHLVVQIIAAFVAIGCV